MDLEWELENLYRTTDPRIERLWLPSQNKRSHRDSPIVPTFRPLDNVFASIIFSPAPSPATIPAIDRAIEPVASQRPNPVPEVLPDYDEEERKEPEAPDKPEESDLDIFEQDNPEELRRFPPKLGAFSRIPLRPEYLEEYKEGKSYSLWTEAAILDAPLTFFEWRNIEHPTTYFLAKFPEAYQTQKALFHPLVARNKSNWSDFVRTALTLAHFVALASEEYQPRGTHLTRPFLFRYHTEEGLVTRRRDVPLGEVLAVLASNIEEDAGYRTILYGIATKLGVAYTFDGAYKLPVSLFRVHTDILLLAASFLVELGVLDVEVGRFDSQEDLYDLRIAPGLSYGDRVRGLRALEEKLDVTDFLERTDFFTLSNEYPEQAWYSLLATAYEDLNRSCTYNPLINIYERRNAYANYDPHEYYCPAVVYLPSL